MFLGFGLNEPPNLPPCFKVAHLFGFVERLFRRFFGPMLTYLGSKRLKLLPVTSRGSTPSSKSKTKKMKEIRLSDFGEELAMEIALKVETREGFLKSRDTKQPCLIGNLASFE